MSNMKKLIQLTLIVIFSLSTFARSGKVDSEASYIVPTVPELVPHSRFKIKIIDGYKGPETQRISYVFPEQLIGEANKVISFTRIKNTMNSWTSPELNAHCTADEYDFSCNIYINKANELNPLTVEQSISNLQLLNLPEATISNLTGVIQSFFSHEPAGFMSYEID